MSQILHFGAAQDDVAVYDGFSQVFRDARPVKGTVRETARLMEHPIESGVNVVDHKVIKAVEIDLECVLRSENYRDTYQEIKKLFLDSSFLSVQTRNAIYENMILENLPHEEDPAMFNSISVDLKFKEAVVVEAEYGELPPKKVADKNMSSTQKAGEVQGRTDSGDSRTMAQKLFGSAS